MARRRRADLACGELYVLVAYRIEDVGGCQVELPEPVGVQPDAHAVLARAEDPHQAHAGQPRKRVLHVDLAVIGQEDVVVAVVFRIEADDQKNVRRNLLNADALQGNAAGELGECGVYRVLHEGERLVEVGPDVESYSQRVGAVASAGGEHVNGALHAIDRLLQGHAYRLCDDGGACSGIPRRHLYGRRGDGRILLHGKPDIAYDADDDGNDGEDICQDGAVDEKCGDHGSRPPAFCGVTLRPGIAF